MSPNFPTESGWSCTVRVCGGYQCPAAMATSSRAGVSTLESPSDGCTRKLKDYFKFDVSKASDILKINNNIKQVIQQRGVSGSDRKYLEEKNLYG